MAVGQPAASDPASPSRRRGGRSRIPLPPAVLGRMGGRVLDPSRAGSLRDKPVAATAYVANELLLQGRSTSALDALVDAARATKHTISTGSDTPDAAVVSTFPTTLDGALEPRRRTRLGEDIDPDDFQSGFGLWSGTSFSGPYLAGRLAARMFSGGTLDRIDAKSSVTRGWAAVKAEVGWRRP
jgi:hypothetical protein